MDGIRRRRGREVRTSGCPERGQAVAELAVILPLLLTIVAGGLDFGRAFERQVKLEQAVRQASATVSTISPSQSAAGSTARQIICVQLGFPATCTNVTVQVAFSLSSSALGATATNPLATTTVTTTLGWQTLVPWPFITGDGTIDLRAASTYSVLQGR